MSKVQNIFRDLHTYSTKMFIKNKIEEEQNVWFRRHECFSFEAGLKLGGWGWTAGIVTIKVTQLC